MLEVNDTNFEEEVLKSESLAVVDFWAEWCGPCRMMAPVFEEVSNEKTGVKFAKMDVDQAPQTAAKFGIMSIPTILFFKNGEKVHQLVGLQQKEQLIEAISSFE